MSNKHLKTEFGVVRIYDSGGATYDRYTAVYMFLPEGIDTYTAVGMSDEPFHPQGFGQHCTAMPGKHLGKLIAFDQLPRDCQRLIQQDLQDVSTNQRGER